MAGCPGRESDEVDKGARCEVCVDEAFGIAGTVFVHHPNSAVCPHGEDFVQGHLCSSGPPMRTKAIVASRRDLRLPQRAIG